MHSPVKNDAQPRHTHVTHTYTEREGQRERQTRLLLVQPCLRRQARCVRACAGKPDGLAQREGVGVRDLNRGERDGERRSRGRGRGRGREGGSTLLLARSFARAILGGIARGLAYSGGGSHSKGRGTHGPRARAWLRGWRQNAFPPNVPESRDERFVLALYDFSGSRRVHPSPVTIASDAHGSSHGTPIEPFSTLVYTRRCTHARTHAGTLR